MITEAVILSSCRALTALFEFMCTPEGQLQAKEWREDRAKFKSDVDGIAAWFRNILHR